MYLFYSEKALFINKEVVRDSLQVSFIGRKRNDQILLEKAFPKNTDLLELYYVKQKNTYPTFCEQILLIHRNCENFNIIDYDRDMIEI